MSDPTPPRFRDARVGGCIDVVVEHRPDGTTRLHSPEALEPYPERLSDRLEHWACTAPDRVFAARRAGVDRHWQTITYAAMLDRAKALGQALVERGLSVERPLVILSGNDLEHLSLTLAAMWVGVPVVPVSPAYSLLSQDYGKLAQILETTTPGMVYASDAAYARPIETKVTDDVLVVMGDAPPRGRARGATFAELLATTPGPRAQAAHDATHGDTLVKFMFTSGSTKAPKGVITTNRMLCANQQQIRQCMAFLADEPPVLIDWLPWNHVFGGNHNVGIALYNGGTIYIDDGKPTPQGMRETLANLREVAPSIYFNVPRGLEEIALAMDTDEALRRSFFSRCKAIMFAGAGLSQAVWDKLDAHGEATCGERLRVISGLGMTEAAPSCTFVVGTHARSGFIGLPAPGVSAKLVPDGDKVEIRFAGPNITPGYWRNPAETKAAFDDEGFYRTGDAVAWIDPAQPRRGLRFDGRVAEDFKLATGTFVSVGPLRSRLVLEGDPCVQDAVITGLDRNEVGALIIPRVDGVRALAQAAPDIPMAQVLGHGRVRAFFQALVDRLWDQASGSASRVARLHVLAEPPSIDRGEITDKGSINQRAVLTLRATLVQALYDGTVPEPFVVAARSRR